MHAWDARWNEGDRIPHRTKCFRMARRAHVWVPSSRLVGIDRKTTVEQSWCSLYKGVCHELQDPSGSLSTTAPGIGEHDLGRGDRAPKRRCRRNATAGSPHPLRRREARPESYSTRLAFASVASPWRTRYLRITASRHAGPLQPLPGPWFGSSNPPPWRPSPGETPNSMNETHPALRCDCPPGG
jgi:hypothetical protein